MRLFVFLFLISTTLSALGQSQMSSSEIGYIYDLEHEFLIDHRVAANGNDHKVFIKFTLNSGNVKVSDYMITYDLRDGYISERTPNSEVRLDSSNVLYTGFREFVYSFDIDNAGGKDLVVLDIYNIPKNRRFKYDISLVQDDKRPTSFLIYDAELDIPYFNKYVNAGDPIRIKDVFTDQGSFEITGFQNNAPIPMPPFDDTERPEPEAVNLDTLYGAQNNEVFSLYNEGYYKINASNNREESLNFLVSNEFYPYFGNYNDLIRPLIFLSTNSEYEAMTAALDTREGFEEFVQNTISGNERVAKDFIKYYYRRIRKAGRLFTEDREGWKTDKGMVYLIFGDPLQVFRNEQTELWVYSSGSGGRLRFVFDIVDENGLVKYKLLRGKRFKEDWMTAVTQWRAGRIIE